ncbi:hypothetical protein DPMN_112343 [Dreissena polymorpha]|uniref:Uncharacterized protein n=1 Tax=Dreissena polymorpha TaxID=45954 RepID=A0A9D4KFX5_DREPO|nr:hypothetical protein DPMN_112343 [Dreissena polymorpha]
MTTTPLSSPMEDPTPRFADDIDLMGGPSSERQNLINRVYERARACEIQVGTE